MLHPSAGRGDLAQRAPAGPASLCDVVLTTSILQTMCPCLPHSAHPRCKVLCFLRLRTTCCDFATAVSPEIGVRVSLLLRHRLQDVQYAAVRIRDSGFLQQLLLCGGRPARAELLRVDSVSGLPLGMTQAYWDERQSRKAITGWAFGDPPRLHL